MLNENKVFKVNTKYGYVFCVCGKDGKILTDRGNVFPSIKYGTREYENIPNDVVQRMLDLKYSYDMYIEAKQKACFL